MPTNNHGASQGSLASAPVRRLLALLAAAVMLTACSEGSTGTGASPSTSTSPTASVTASGTPPTEEQTAWAGQVCTDVGQLKKSIDGLATAATTGGGDVKTALTAQFATIKKSAATLVDTVKAVPPGSGDDPDLVAVQTAAGQLRASVDTLEKAVNDLQGTSGVATVQAIAAVVTAANASISALGATTQAISTAAKDSKGTIAQAFAANSSCTSLTP